MLDGALRFADGWTLAEDMLRLTNGSTGVLFTTSNGYLGVRGRRREPVGDDGLVLVAGCHEIRPYAHPERSFGVPEHYQTIVAVTDPTGVAITLDGVRVTPESGTWLDHTRRLDLRTGCVTTAATWRSPGGGTFTLRSRRIVSLREPGVVWTETEVEAVEGRADAELVLEMRANTADRTFPDEPEALSRAWGRVFQPRGVLAEGDCAGMVHVTALSRQAVACVAAVTANVATAEVVADDDLVRRTVRGPVGGGGVVSVVQRAVFADGAAEGASELLTAAGRRAEELASVSFDDALAGQRQVLDEFWATATVDIDGAPEVEAAVRFATFQVFQAAACKPERAAPAKGLSGQGYEGHQLWDQELYMGQVLTLLVPQAARAGLAFRCRTLPEARARAGELSCRGAQYPWRTIDGTEASAFFPAGAAQHHINADIAWAIEQYVRCTGDDSILREGGLEVLVETARFWMSLGRFGPDGEFRIDGVTGPDEYTALVDNNLYTNLMAATNLRAAADRMADAAATDASWHARVVDGLQLDPEEPDRWRAAAGAVLVPYDEDLAVHGQDDSFLRLPRWDLDATPEEDFPLQDHHHLLTLYRHQVLKQADVVFALYALPEAFTADERRRAFEYYEPLTTHDSSLSAPIHAIVAATIGETELAWKYLRDSAFVDLDSLAGTLGDGLHLASAAGTWLAVAYGFGGFALRDGVPTFGPRLPPGVTRLRFGLRLGDGVLEVDVTPAATAYRAAPDGARIAFRHGDEPIELAPGDSTSRPHSER